jgi:hypothetical protein
VARYIENPFPLPPRQTVSRVFPVTAFRRSSPYAYQQPLSLKYTFQIHLSANRSLRHSASKSVPPSGETFNIFPARRLFHYMGQSNHHTMHLATSVSAVTSSASYTLHPVNSHPLEAITSPPVNMTLRNISIIMRRDRSMVLRSG